MLHKKTQEIIDNINERMSHYTHSMHPTDDEVRIAWLVTEIEEMEKENKKVKWELSLLKAINCEKCGDVEIGCVTCPDCNGSLTLKGA